MAPFMRFTVPSLLRKEPFGILNNPELMVITALLLSISKFPLVITKILFMVMEALPCIFTLELLVTLWFIIT